MKVCFPYQLMSEAVLVTGQAGSIGGPTRLVEFREEEGRE